MMSSQVHVELDHLRFSSRGVAAYRAGTCPVHLVGGFLRGAHTFVFRSYALIVESAEADLMRDVCFDMHKAQVNSRLSGDKLQPIASSRVGEKLLTSAESRLSAAIVAARPLTAGKVEP